jgi:hypothetical protein
VDRAVAERPGQRRVDELVLLDQRPPVERRRGNGDLEMVAAAGTVLDKDLAVGKRLLEQRADRVGGHAAIVAASESRMPGGPTDRCAVGDDVGMPRAGFLLSLPERLLRSVAALAGGTVHETAQLVLPRLVRRSRLYEATAKNLLRVSIELVGGVEGSAGVGDEYEPDAKRLAVRKTAGNAVEIGSIAAFGFSPLWLLAAAADITRGTRTYLDALVGELKLVGVLAPEAHLESVDDLLASLEGTSGAAARLVDIPPLELQALRRSLSELRNDAARLPSPKELASLYDGLRAAAAGERSSLLEVSSGIGIAFFNSARHVGRQHLLDPYTEDLRPLRDEGFGAYATRVSAPYGEAVMRQLDPEHASLTERGLDRLRRER